MALLNFKATTKIEKLYGIKVFLKKIVNFEPWYCVVSFLNYNNNIILLFCLFLRPRFLKVFKILMTVFLVMLNYKMIKPVTQVISKIYLALILQFLVIPKLASPSLDKPMHCFLLYKPGFVFFQMDSYLRCR